VTAPVLAVAAILIRIESRGPVIFRQRRVGLDGRPFDLWKLRTMVSGAEAMGAGIYVLEGDPRITRAGRLLRRFSLDELPNLVNVLRGEMAMVGPRPTVQEQVDRYTDRQLDVWYVDNRSLLLDLKILLRTARLLLTGRGLYSETLRQGWD
jgi:lipopolysaccharide/colanic/teichoic acid biosynthesis glycosyltransferase